MALSPEQRRKLVEAGYSNQKIAAYERSTSTGVPSSASQPTGIERFTKPAATVADAVFGGGKFGEVIGTGLARGDFGQTAQRLATGRDLTPEEEKNVTLDVTGKEILGDTIRVGANFAPVGKIAGAFGKGAMALGVGPKVAQFAGNVAAGALTGAVADTGVSMAQGGNPRLGLGTLIGAGIPAVSPIIGALSKATAKYAGKGASEIQGVLTGTSAETIEQAFNAAKSGGDDLSKFTQALRGKTTPEQLVNNVRENIASVAANRQSLFADTLKELADIPVSTAPAKQSFIKELQETGISLTDDGILDFSNSKLRTVPNAQSKLQQAWNEIIKMPETLSLAEIDTTRQAIKGIKAIGGNEPSANLANMLIDDAVRSVRSAGEQVSGYGKMLDNFAETSDFLDELERGISSGDRSTIDQAYRRMATALKTNNEQRKALIEQLDQATGGAILSSISGQQLSEVLPRGIFRQIAAAMAAGSAVTGGISSSWLPSLVLASPRVTGEVVRALGLGAAKVDAILDAIGTVRNVLTKMGAIGGSQIERFNQSPENAEAENPDNPPNKEGQDEFHTSKSTTESPYTQEEMDEMVDMAMGFGPMGAAGALKKAIPAAIRIARNIDGRDLQLIREILSRNDLKTFKKVQPMLRAMGIEDVPFKTQRELLKRVLEFSTRKLKVKSE